MNPRENRVLLDDHISRFVFSGEIGNNFVIRFKPLIFKSKFSALLHKFPNISWKTIPVASNSNFTMPTTNYIWLKFKDGRKGNLVIKVYNEDCKNIPHNSSIIYHSGKVMIKRLGYFVWSDFVEFVF